jgi:protein ImuA
MLLNRDMCEPMSDTTAKIAALRASLAKAELENPDRHARVPLGHEGADACLQGGLSRGALHEIFAEGGHETSTMGFAAALSFRIVANKPVPWVRQDFSAAEFGELAATGFLELGLDPSRLLLLRVADAKDVLCAANDALSCRAFAAVVIEIPGDPKILDHTASRRLSLAAAQNGVTAFLLRFSARAQASAAETRWRVRAARSPDKEENWGNPIFETELVRNRHGLRGHWIMEWSCDDGFFREPCDKAAENSGIVASASSNRSIASAMESAGETKAV